MMKLCDIIESETNKLYCQNKIKAMNANELKLAIKKYSTKDICAPFCKENSNDYTFSNLLGGYETLLDSIIEQEFIQTLRNPQPKRMTKEFEILNELTRKVNTDGQCTVCETAVTLLKNELTKHDIQQQIVNVFCSVFPDGYHDTCITLSNTYLLDFVDRLENTPVLQLCQIINLC